MNALSLFVCNVAKVQKILNDLQEELNPFDACWDIRGNHDGTFSKFLTFKPGRMSSHQAMSMQQKILPYQDDIDEACENFLDVLKHIYTTNHDAFRQKNARMGFRIGQNGWKQDIAIFFGFPKFLFDHDAKINLEKKRPNTIGYRRHDWEQYGLIHFQSLLSCQPDLKNQKYWRIQVENDPHDSFSEIKVMAKNEKTAMAFLHMKMHMEYESNSKIFLPKNPPDITLDTIKEISYQDYLGR